MKSNEKERLFWVSLPYATFGIVSRHGRVYDTAPIAKWMIGKPLEDLRGWMRLKKAIVKEIK
jgi:hypothetical protein